MAVNVRRVPKLMIAAVITLANQLVADVANAALRTGNRLIAMLPIAAIVADLTAIRTQVVAALVDIQAALTRYENGTITSGALADGTTDGKIKTAADINYRIKGRLYFKAGTDDLWNLTAEVDTDGTHYRAYWLYLDSNGAASFVAGTDALTSEANAIAALPAVDATKSVIGVYVAGPSTDFNGAAGLDSFGNYYNGWPAAVTMTASAPAAVTTSTTYAIANGGTAGKLKLVADAYYSIGGTQYRKSAADDVWDLSAQTDTTGSQYRAIALYLDSGGTASIGAGANATSAALARAALPATPSTKALIGVFVAGVSTDFDGVGGLSGQGTIYTGHSGTDASDAITSEAITLIGA